MTSGRFASIPLASIVVDRPTRQRREIDGIAELAESIAARGLINPIVVTQDHVLVAGERRYTACKSLGHDHINVQYVDDLTESELRLIELEENTKRKDVPWQDQTSATTEIHRLRLLENPDWTIKQTADSLGVDYKVVRNHIALQKEIEAGNEQIAKAGNISAASNLLLRKNQREDVNLINTILGAPANAIPLYHVDAFEWIETYEGPPFNFIHCDFPYGINFHKQVGQNSGNFDRYEDSFAVYERLIQELLPRLPLADSAHIMFWFSMNHFEYTKLALIKQGWVINNFPLFWPKSDNSGLLPDPNRGGRRTYETAFVGTKGDRKIVQPVAMHWHGARGEYAHSSMKPLPMLQHFFRMFVDGSTSMIDPTCGSGNAVWAAKQAGAKHYVGLEAIEQYHKDAVMNWKSLEGEDGQISLSL